MHEELIAAFTSPDASERMTAREESTFAMDDALADGILRIAEGDGAEEIRADALISLGPLVEECGDDYGDDIGWTPELGPPISREMYMAMLQRMRALYDDVRAPKLVRRRAFEVLVRDAKPWQEAEIRRHFAAGDGEWRLTALFAMGHVRGFEKEILDALNSNEGVHLAEAVTAAGRMGVEESAPVVRRLASSARTEHELRLDAIAALPHVDAHSRELLEQLVRSGDATIAAVAEEALEELSLSERLDEEDLEEFGDFDDEEAE